MNNDHNLAQGCVVDLLNEAFYAHAQGKGSEFVKLLQQALEIAESKWGPQNHISNLIRDLIREHLAKHSSANPSNE